MSVATSPIAEGGIGELWGSPGGVVVYIEEREYSGPASEREILVPAYNEGREQIYPSQMGYALGDIALGMLPFAREPAIINQNVNQTLTFTHLASKNLTITKEINQTLNLVQDVIGGKIYSVTVEQTLTFDEIIGRRYDIEINQSLTFTEQLDRTATFNRAIAQQLVLTQTPQKNATFNKSVAHNLTFSHTVAKQKIANRTVEQTLTFSQVLKRVKDASVSQTLTFVGVATQNRDRDVYVSQKLIFNQTAGRSMSFQRAVSQQLIFKEAKVFSPINATLITIPFASYTLVNAEEPFVILEGATSLVVLPPPEFGDSDKPEHEVRVARSMNNVVYSFIKRNLLRTLKYEFEIGRVKALELQQFLDLNAGKPIFLKNWKGERWYGNVINQPFNTTLESRFAPCTREKASVIIEFSGMKL